MKVALSLIFTIVCFFAAILSFHQGNNIQGIMWIMLIQLEGIAASVRK